MRTRHAARRAGMLLALAALLLAGCGSTAPAHGPTVLTYWYTEGTGAAATVQQLIAQFERLNPAIRVRAQAVDLASAYGQFVAATRAGHPPDALRIATSWVPALADAGALLPLDSVAPDTADFLPAPLHGVTWHDRLYALPQETDLLALYYNKALFQTAHIAAPPSTWAAFTADARALTTPTQFGWSFQGSAYIAQAFLYGFGGGLLDASVSPPTILIDDPASVASLIALKQALAYAPPVNFTTGYTDALAAFESGSAAMLLDGSWDYDALRAASAFGTADNLGVAAVPFDPACCDAATPRAVAGGQSYAVAAGSAHAAAAVQFIAFMAASASQATIAAHDHALPARLSAYADPAVRADPDITTFVPLLPTQVQQPISLAGDQIYAPVSGLDTELRNFLTGTEDAPTAARHIAQAVRQLLAPT